MDELMRLLREQAAIAGDGTASVDSWWKVETSSDMTHVVASANKLSESPEAAWVTATGLYDAIVGLGYKPYGGGCRLGIVSEQGEGSESASASLSERMPIVGWRGQVDLLVETR